MKIFTWYLALASAACAPQLVVTGGAGGTGGGGTGGGGTGGTGGSIGCTDVVQCPAPGPCATATCTEGVCGYSAFAAGTPCVGDPTRVCDAGGACVQCVDDTPCTPPDTCFEGFCVPEHCSNATKDADETGTDCGGSCSPCLNGEPCNEAKDCKTGHCPAGVCEACTTESACVAGSWCNLSSGEGFCTPTLDIGFSCGDATQCTLGFCVDGVCCDQACDTTCAACRGDYTLSQSGLCLPVALGTDPDLECGTGAEVVVCSTSSLVILYCDGAGQCTSQVSQDCKPYLCSDVGCWTICEDQNGCVPEYYCDVPNMTCAPQLAAGEACTEGYECQSGNCLGTCQ